MKRTIVKTNRVYLSQLCDYEYDNVKNVLFPLFDSICMDNGFDGDFLKNKSVTIKPNLLSRSAVSKCVTSHPSFVRAACEYFCSKGSKVTVADSPGGLYNHGTFYGICKETGMIDAVMGTDAVINDDYGFEMTHDKQCSKFGFNIINPIKQADVVVNLNRLKTHALCEMSASVKNMFGAIPGLQKAEQHARFPEEIKFADMLCDLCLMTSPQINITDAVIAMEGNGPSGGTLKKVGVVTASANPFMCDVLNCYLMGYDYNEVTTVKCAVKRGLCVDSTEALEIIGESPQRYASRFIRPDSRAGGIVKQIPSIFGGHLKAVLEPRPAVKKNLCVGCGICANNCPVEAIEITDKKAKINKEKCIKCYCCQEFCPKEAIKARSVLFFH